VQAASRKGHIAVIPLLLDRGADVIESESMDREDVLEATSIAGHEATVRLLLDRRADVRLKGFYGSALEAATQYDQERVLWLLREHMKVR